MGARPARGKSNVEVFATSGASAGSGSVRPQGGGVARLEHMTTITGRSALTRRCDHSRCQPSVVCCRPRTAFATALDNSKESEFSPGWFCVWSNTTDRKGPTSHEAFDPSAHRGHRPARLAGPQRPSGPDRVDLQL